MTKPEIERKPFEFSSFSYFEFVSDFDIRISDFLSCCFHRPNGQVNARPRAFRPIQQPQAVQRLSVRRSQKWQTPRRRRYSASSTKAQPSPTGWTKVSGTVFISSAARFGLPILSRYPNDPFVSSYRLPTSLLVKNNGS